MEGKHYDKIIEDDLISNSGSITTTTAGSWWGYTTPDYDIQQEPVVISTPIFNYPAEYYVWKWGIPKENKSKGGDDNMRYLYEVILVNPKNDTLHINEVIARSETSALMEVYNDSKFKDAVLFDDLKTSCRVLMEWKKEKSLKKAIETIKKAVE